MSNVLPLAPLEFRSHHLEILRHHHEVRGWEGPAEKHRPRRGCGVEDASPLSFGGIRKEQGSAPSPRDTGIMEAAGARAAKTRGKTYLSVLSLSVKACATAAMVTSGRKGGESDRRREGEKKDVS